jgi:SAM-dependent methyltransferase
VGALCATQESAFRATKGDLKLSLCRNCSYIWNRSYEHGKHEFISGYEISLHYSPTYQRFLDDLAKRLVKDYALQSKTVLEIACGTGHFLRMLCRLGGNSGIGIDPVLEREGVEDLGSSRISFHRDKFSKGNTDLDCDFICCRQALHAIEDPRKLVETVREAIGKDRQTPVYFEVVNAASLFKKQVIWQLMYEYCSFFTPDALTRLFMVCGFEVRRVQPCYEDDQYLQIEAVPIGGARKISMPDAADHHAILDDVTAFSKGFRKKIDGWQAEFEEIQRLGRRAIVWGAGGRGINFMNLVKSSQFIPYVVDINPSRQGGYIPGTGQQVVAPTFLREYCPDVIVLTNPTYAQEVQEQVVNMGLRCDFLLAS